MLPAPKGTLAFQCSLRAIWKQHRGAFSGIGRERRQPWSGRVAINEGASGNLSAIAEPGCLCDALFG